MKILQINNCHYRRGGADIVYLNTGELLERRGHDVYYFSQKNRDIDYHANASEYFVDSIDYFNNSTLKKIFSVPRFFYSRESRNKLNNLVKNIKPDIAHIHLYKGTLTPSILPVLKRRRIPVIITLHDYGLLCPHNLFLDGKMNICEKCISGSALNCIANKCNRNNFVLSAISALEFIFHKTFIPFNTYFDQIVAVSHFGQNLHNDSNRFSRKVMHLYNFFPNLHLVQPKKSRGKYFLFYGRLSKEKGLMTLIDAWRSKTRESVLKIVGTGELYEKIKCETNSEPNIEILGFRSGLELENLIKNASFVIVPSEWYENNPLTIIEAYSFGKPIIGSEAGGITEIIKENDTGFIFPMGNADSLSTAIENAASLSDEQYEKMSLNARKFAEDNFSEDKHYERLLSIYNSVLKCQDEKVNNY